jgi:integrase
MTTPTTLPSHERPILIRVSHKPNLPPGITRRPSGRYQAQVFVGAERRRKSKTFDLLSEARAWKRDTEAGLARGTVAERSSPTLSKAGAEWLAAAHDGAVRNRSGQRYRPSTLRGYAHALETRLYPALGSTRLSEIRRGTLNRLLGKLQAQGLSASTTRNILMPLRAIFRWALDLELIAVNPTSGLALPQDSGRRERFATATELTALLAALPERDRALWATAAYAGLRRGELMALRWSEVDLGVGIIHVNRSHNPESGSTGEPKSRAGNRRVPIPPVLRDYLLEHSMRARPSQPLVFARSALAGRRRGPDGPFSDSGVCQRARQAWAEHGLQSITLHECRHTYASLMIAAEESPKALQTYLGHSSITTTYDRYGHMMPAAEAASANRLQRYLDADTTVEWSEADIEQ